MGQGFEVVQLWKWLQKARVEERLRSSWEEELGTLQLARVASRQEKMACLVWQGGWTKLQEEGREKKE